MYLCCVQDPGAFPSDPYHLAFWGFPCDLYSGLQRSGDPAEVRRALSDFDAALHRLQSNPPQVFILENTASLFAHPSALSHICRSLAALPYDWRYTPHSSPLLPAHPSFTSPPAPACADANTTAQAAATSPQNALTRHLLPSRCTLICPHADFDANITRPRLWWVGYRR